MLGRAVSLCRPFVSGLPPLAVPRLTPLAIRAVLHFNIYMKTSHTLTSFAPTRRGIEEKCMAGGHSILELDSPVANVLAGGAWLDEDHRDRDRIHT